MISIAVFGCSSGSDLDNQSVKNEASFNKNYDEVWAYVVEYFVVNNIPVSSISREEGTIKSVYEIPSEDFLKFTESGSLSKLGEIESSVIDFTVNVRPDIDGATYITSTARFTAKVHDDNNARLIEKNYLSNSAYEKDFFKYLEEKANEMTTKKQ